MDRDSHVFTCLSSIRCSEGRRAWHRHYSDRAESSIPGSGNTPMSLGYNAHLLAPRIVDLQVAVTLWAWLHTDL